jgi:hypothetical protein
VSLSGALTGLFQIAAIEYWNQTCQNSSWLLVQGKYLKDVLFLLGAEISQVARLVPACVLLFSVRFLGMLMKASRLCILVGLFWQLVDCQPQCIESISR